VYWASAILAGTRISATWFAPASGSDWPPVAVFVRYTRKTMIDPENTILVVEDDRDVREIAVAVLEAARYRVLEAASGDEAYRLLQAHPDLRIDLLFTDVVMPGQLDGIDLAIKARTLRPGLKVLYATGFANLVRNHREDELHGLVLAKPYRPAELHRAISALIGETAE
jgi:CheY-like chemotaxis protein